MPRFFSRAKPMEFGTNWGSLKRRLESTTTRCILVVALTQGLLVLRLDLAPHTVAGLYMLMPWHNLAAKSVSHMMIMLVLS
ncbi:hypothetical protein NL676_013277 [Syzygium grande]|nr:hypothetical protein NL676_013277 [Syzygium grande]